MILDIPFELGQVVWIWENRPTYCVREVSDGYDHLGARRKLETIWTDHWGAYQYKFRLGLLDDHKIDEIYTSKYECEMAAKSAF